jgi:cytochrome P450
MASSMPLLTAKPDYVPADRVVDFDYVNPAGMAEVGVYAAMKRLHDGPDIVWTPRYGGHWVVTRAEDIKFVQENHEIFSHEVFLIPKAYLPMRLLPLTADPPEHARYRAVVNPGFTPNKIMVMREKARELTIELAEKMKPAGGCEFVNEFARVMPVTMFLGMVDLPLDRREEFLRWGNEFMTSTSGAHREEVLQRITAYLREVLDERDHGTGDDLLTRVSAWRHHPRFRDMGEVQAMALNLFLAGLDTVASALSFIAMHLAEHPQHRKRLREDPDCIPRATEEYLRRFGLSNTGRLVRRDFTYKGITFRKDDMVMVPINLSGLDDRMYDNPMEVDFDRNALHNTFGNGAHRCVGAPLARVEIQVFLEEFVRRIPEFRLDPRRPPTTHGGSVPGVNHLHLLWN